ncbi:hypothetical protein [Massilia sp. Mn16-1_5]|uniref:hypothetical protein n=1 Tax=Massilia sp. Mn16-1_5 TaxID=2079199 RepID=UPI00109E3963|nr:hypothetical protein [Massilia sp. Mn16-1_5]
MLPLKEVAMDGTLLLAALLGAQAPPAACADLSCAARADSALPARAAAAPAPQLGTVAPNAPVPSWTDTPSRRAMAAAAARDEKNTDDQKKMLEEQSEEAAPKKCRQKPRKD